MFRQGIVAGVVGLVGLDVEAEGRHEKVQKRRVQSFAHL